MQFALFAGLIITALLLNTATFVLSILLLYALPEGVSGSVVSYTGILIGLSLLAWLLLLGGGSAILHQERHGYSSMPLKLGIMITVLLLYTIIFLLSCILLSIFQNDLQESLLAARNYTASILAVIFVAWVLLLTGSALLSKKPMSMAAPMTSMAVPMTSIDPRSLPTPLPYDDEQPLRWPNGRYSYGMTHGRRL